jgi:hypothetical protein
MITVGAAADHAQREIDFGRGAVDEIEGQGRRLKHDPEKWEPVSRLREAQAPVCRFVRCFGGRRQVGKDHV